MCAIFTLLPEQSIDDKMLENVVGNNLDGYGIILQDLSTKHLEVRRGFTEDGTDPEEIARILADHKALTRHVHVRNTTEGKTNLDNTHPFLVFDKNGRQVWMLHNGTMHKFKPSHGSEASDTKLMAESFLSPLLNRFSGEFGLGDYNDPIFKRILEEFMGTYNNRILLVSNDLEPLQLGNWLKVKSTTGDEFQASNNDYFSVIKRGPRRPLPVVVPSMPNGGTMTSGAGTNATTDQKVLVRPPYAGPMGSSYQPPKTDQPKSLEKKGKEVTPLKEVNRVIRGKYEPSKTLMEAMGASKEAFNRYGFASITWIKDEELEAAFKRAPVSELVQLFRAMCNANESLAADVDMAEQVIQNVDGVEDDHIDLIEKIKKLEEMVEFYSDVEEVNQNLARENKNLKVYQNYLRQSLVGKQIPYQSLDSFETEIQEAAEKVA